MSEVDVFKSYVGKKVLVESKLGKMYGVLKSVDERFIVLDPNNENFYLDNMVIAIDQIEMLGLLANKSRTNSQRTLLQP